MPKPKKKVPPRGGPKNAAGPGVRSFWSGTITFGLVSIPVDLLSAIRPRQTAMKLVDKEGHPLGRQYRCSNDGKKLDNDDLVRGYETDDGKMVTITDEELESVAPEMSSDINLRNFVPGDQIPPVYFQKSYFLAPAGKSARSYNLLAATMQHTGRVGIGSFVMRGHEYLVAIIADNGMLRADTLRYADELRSPTSIDLPSPSKAAAKLVNQFRKEVEALKRNELNLPELEDKRSEELQALAKTQQKNKANVVHHANLEEDDEEAPAESAQVIDLIEVLRRSLSKKAVVTNAKVSAPIDLDERRALKRGAVMKSASKSKSSTAKRQ